MTIKSKISAFVASCLLSGSVFASAACPELTELQSEGLYMVTPIYGNIYAALAMNHYNTDSIWGFAIGPMAAESENDALNAANELLGTMTSPGVLLQDGSEKVCQYDTNNPYIFAVAVKGDFVSADTLKKYLNKTH